MNPEQTASGDPANFGLTPGLGLGRRIANIAFSAIQNDHLVFNPRSYNLYSLFIYSALKHRYDTFTKDDSRIGG